MLFWERTFKEGWGAHFSKIGLERTSYMANFTPSDYVSSNRNHGDSKNDYAFQSLIR